MDIEASCPACSGDGRRVVCFTCYLARRGGEEAHAEAVTAPMVLRSPFEDRQQPLTEREVAHRQRMLQHLAISRGVRL
jgi:hypothetical protein